MSNIDTAPSIAAPGALIEALLPHCHRRQVPAKGIIVRQGEPPHDLFYLVSGSVSVVLENVEGHMTVLAYLNAGDFFGEQGLFNDHINRCALVRARVPCEVAQISYERLRGLTSIYSEILFCIARQLAHRLCAMNRRAWNLVYVDVAGRVAETLLDLCRQPDARIEADGVHIRTSGLEISRIIGASREMVGRVLKELEDHAVITVHGKTTVVHLGRAAPRVPMLVLPRRSAPL